MMASSLKEDLVCPICLALFQKPYMLECGHNFCLTCLRRVVPAGQEKGTCPECRSPFRVQELKHNRALDNLAVKVRRWKGDEELLPEHPAGAWHFCEDHNEPLKLFCTQEKLLICVICRELPQHRGHDFLPTKNAVQWAQRKLKAYLKDLENHLKETTEDETDQLKEIEALKNCAKGLLGHISKEFEALHQILHKKEQDIKMMVEKVKGENMNEMVDSITLLKEEASLYTEAIAKIKAALETTDHTAFLKGLKVLMEQVKEDHQGKMEDYEEAEEKSDDEAEGKSDQDGSGEEQGECSDSDDEDDEDYESDETSDDRVVPVKLGLENFGESLEFDTWKKMLESIKPRQVN